MKNKRDSGNLFDRVFDAMQARRARQDRQALMFFGVGCAVFIVIAIIMVIVGLIMTAVETATVKSLYGDAIASACNPVPEGRESLDNMPDAPPIRSIVLFIAETQQRHNYHEQVPNAWRADAADDVVLVGCVQEEAVLLETCEYVRDGTEGDTFTIRIEREQYETTIIIVDPYTSRRIASQTLLGTEPESCPPDDSSVTNSGTQRGEKVAWSEFAGWIETFVFDE